MLSETDVVSHKGDSNRGPGTVRLDQWMFTLRLRSSTVAGVRGYAQAWHSAAQGTEHLKLRVDWRRLTFDEVEDNNKVPFPLLQSYYLFPAIPAGM
jgi:hypothetical protein